MAYEMDAVVVACLVAAKMSFAVGVVGGDAGVAEDFVDKSAAETEMDVGQAVKEVLLEATKRIWMIFGLPVLMYLTTMALQLQSLE